MKKMNKSKALLMSLSVVAGACLSAAALTAVFDAAEQSNGLGFLQGNYNVAFAEGETTGEATSTVTISNTKYMVSNDGQYMLLATAFEHDSVTSANSIGYTIQKGEEAAVDYFGNVYYVGLDIGGTVWTAGDIFGSAYADCELIVYEIANYDVSVQYKYQAFVKADDTVLAEAPKKQSAQRFELKVFDGNDNLVHTHYGSQKVELDTLKQYVELGEFETIEGFYYESNRGANVKVGDYNLDKNLEMYAKVESVFTGFDYTYYVEAATNAEGNPEVTLAGNVYSNYAEFTGAKVAIDVEINDANGVAQKIYQYSDIGENDSWSVAFELTPEIGFTYDQLGWFHIKLVKADEQETVLAQKDDTANLSNNQCLTALGGTFNEGTNFSGYVVAGNADESVGYVIGKGDSGSINLYGKEGLQILEINKADVSVDSTITLENRNDRVCIVISGNTAEYRAFGTTDEEIATAIKNMYFCDIQVNQTWGYPIGNNFHVVNMLENGAFEILFDITGLPIDSNHSYLHLGTESSGAAYDFKPTSRFDYNVVVGSYEYRLRCDGETCWGLIYADVVKAGDPAVEATAAELELIDGAPYLVYTLDYKYCTVEYIQANYVTDVEYTGQKPVLTDRLYEEVDADTVKVKVNLSSLPVANPIYMHGKWNGDTANGDFPLTMTIDMSQYILVGTKKYSFTNDQWNNRVMKIEDFSSVDINAVSRFINASFETDESSVYFVVTGIYIGIEKTTVEGYTPYLDLQRNANVNGDGNWDTATFAKSLNSTPEAGTYTFVVNDDGTFTVKANITHMSAGGYTTHFGVNGKIGSNSDYQPSVTVSNSTTFNGKNYAVDLRSDNSYWANIGVIVG